MDNNTVNRLKYILQSNMLTISELARIMYPGDGHGRSKIRGIISGKHAPSARAISIIDNFYHSSRIETKIITFDGTVTTITPDRIIMRMQDKEVRIHNNGDVVTIPLKTD